MRRPNHIEYLVLFVLVVAALFVLFTAHREPLHDKPVKQPAPVVTPSPTYEPLTDCEVMGDACYEGDENQGY